MFGAATPAADATVIAVAASVLRRIGLKSVRLHLNSIGCPACRPAYREALVKHFSAEQECLCGTCRERLTRNPLRLLDCKSPICHEIATRAPRTVDHLCPDCEAKFRTVCARWRAGEITATAAMKAVGLKPNTFYRRVKNL
jgi:histidyl-tRNA synthetase